MNIAANPIIEADQTVYLKDYQKPSFLVDSIYLDIQVYDEHSQVDAVLELTRQTDGDLVLLGRDLELKSVVLNGQQLSQEQYTLDAEQLVIRNAPNQIKLETSVIIHPESNTQLEGPTSRSW